MDLNSLTTDEFLNNLDLLFKDEELSQENLINSVKLNDLNSINYNNDATINDHDVEFIEEIKDEPIERQALVS